MNQWREGIIVAALFTVLLHPVSSLAQCAKGGETISSVVSSHFAARQVPLGAPTEAALIKAARDANPVIRLNAARALAKFQDENSTWTLLGMLGDPNAEVCAEASIGFWRTGTARQLAALRRIGTLRKRQAAKLIFLIGGTGKPGLDLLESDLETGPSLARLRIIATYGEVINQYRPELLETSLQSPIPAIRATALMAVRRWGESKADAALALPLLADPSEQVRIQAIFTVSKSPDPPVRRIFAFLHNSSKSVRTAALGAVVVLPATPEAISLDAKLLEDNDLLVARKMAYLIDRRMEEIVYFEKPIEHAFQTAFRLTAPHKLRENLYRVFKRGHSPYAVRALGIMGDPRAFESPARMIKALPPLTPEQDRINRTTPYLELGPDRPPSFPLAMADGRSAAPILLAHMDDNLTEVIPALGKTGSPTAVMPLVEKLKADPNGWVAYALASIGDFRAIPFFIQVITSPASSQQVRGNLLSPLGLLGGPSAADTLMNILDDPNESTIHWQAVAGMQALSDRTSIPTLEKASKNRKGRSLHEAIAALKRLQTAGKA